MPLSPLPHHSTTDDAAAERPPHDERPGVSAHAAFTPGARGRRRPWWRARLPAMMLAGTLLLTAAATSFVYLSLHAADQARFENAVQSAADRVRDRIDTYTALLYGARGLFAASHDVTASEFRRFVEQMDLTRHFRGIRG